MSRKTQQAQIKKIIEDALKEDIGTGDITTVTIVKSKTRGYAEAVAKDRFVIAGIDIFKRTFLVLDKSIKFTVLISDGKEANKGDIIAYLDGPLASILKAERVALNFFQRMCGIATQTKEYVKKVEGTKAKILDTRKTVPGLRLLDKMAVRVGGGINHRMGLYDAVLIKDNHIESAGSITEAVKSQKRTLRGKTKIEVETKNLSQVREALNAGVDIIMLDNMPVNQMKKAVKIVNRKALLEASGNVSLKNVAAIARIGVDYISVGEVTHSTHAADISLKIINKKTNSF